MFRKIRIEETLMQKMKGAFSSTTDRKAAIHLTAVAGAAIVAALPIGIDAWALRIAEIIMVICIAGSYGEKLTKSAAKGLMLSSFAQLVGEGAAITALEVAEASRIAAAISGAGPVIAYAIKSGIAVGLIETVGHLAISFYEHPKGVGAATCKAMEAVGLVADISRAMSLVANSTDTANIIHSDDNLPSSSPLNGKKEISFCGSIYTEKDLVDTTKKVESAKRKVKQYTDYLASDIIFGRDTTDNAIKLKYAQSAYENALRNYERIRKAFKG